MNLNANYRQCTVSDLPFLDWSVKFTAVPSKALSDQVL